MFIKQKEENMNRVILCNTYYQLIFAIQLRKTLFENDDVTVIVSDHSKNAKQIVSKLKKAGVFTNVYYKETLWLRDYNKISFIFDFLKLNKIDLFDDVAKEWYDEFIFYNNCIYTNLLFQKLYKRNGNIKVSQFEESILSYKTVKNRSRKAEICEIYNVVTQRPRLCKSVEKFYCFQPNFYKGKLKPIKIPQVNSNNKVRDILLKIFNVNFDENIYKEKYIFFTSVYDFEGGEPIGEYELVCKIADLVGKENLLVKTHPRDVRTIYEDNGFTVDKNSDIPWEAIQLSRGFSDKVFLTATSGSVLAGSFMSENPPKTFFMHKCCNVLGNSSSQKTIETIEELLCDESLKGTLKTVSIANEIKDILV